MIIAWDADTALQDGKFAGRVKQLGLHLWMAAVGLRYRYETFLSRQEAVAWVEQTLGTYVPRCKLGSPKRCRTQRVAQEIDR